jgi:hypothetical protein
MRNAIKWEQVEALARPYAVRRLAWSDFRNRDLEAIYAAGFGYFRAIGICVANPCSGERCYIIRLSKADKAPSYFLFFCSPGARFFAPPGAV